MSWVLLLAWAASAEPVKPPPAVPDWFPKAVRDVDRSMATVEAGRRLQAAALDLPVEPARLPAGSPPVLFLPGERPALGVDVGRAKTLTAVEFELALVRGRARGARFSGARLIESEQAAEQDVLEYALERAAADEEFGGLLKRGAKKLLAGRAGEDAPAAEEPAPELRLPPRDPDREAELLLRFAKDPERFYWSVERELLQAPGAVRLIELESFLWAYAERLERADCPPAARYCRLEGRLATRELVAAAKATLGAGGLDKLRESVGAFQGDDAARLQRKVQSWLKGL